MAITLFDVVVRKVGKKERYTGADFEEAGVPMFGGCRGCAASLGGWNAYPTRSGYLACKDCVGDAGFGTVAEFWEWARGLEERETRAQAALEGRVPPWGLGSAGLMSDEEAKAWRAGERSWSPLTGEEV
jgi:hypothetical protein